MSPDEWNVKELASVVQNLLTAQVTRSLLPVWQGEYTLERAQGWIRERDREGVTLIVIDKDSRNPIGFIILFETANHNSLELRLGYMLTEAVWGKGLASEPINCFIQWCNHHAVASVTGGVEHDNIASRRVLEKCGFTRDPASENADELMFIWRLVRSITSLCEIGSNSLFRV